MVLELAKPNFAKREYRHIGKYFFGGRLAKTNHDPEDSAGSAAQADIKRSEGK